MPKRLNFTIFLSGMILISMLLGACALQPKEPVSKTGFYFDTAVTLTVYETPSRADEAEALLEKAMAECSRYDTLFAPDNENSEIYKINHAEGHGVMVSDETRDLLYAAMVYSRSFPSYVDLTIAPVKALWDFSGDSDYVPRREELSNALQHVGYGNLSIDGNKVTLSDPEAAIDVGFIAKGYIADKLKEFLTKEGCESAIINLGGNVQTIGRKPDKTPYSVGIQKPFADLGSYLTATDLGSGDSLYSSAATSGVYERCFEKDGTLYHHILDLETGMPVDTDLYSATILTDSSLDADVLSTVCLIMGKDAALTLIHDTPDVDAILVTKENEVIDTRN
ncbi:MAG: FAD:protein FMN transferase [Lachnospiraceae bacterium]|nr:FAD:protein FMN transferase [Lachnospiraceae bacterium]